jgi:hypothetical protein
MSTIRTAAFYTQAPAAPSPEPPPAPVTAEPAACVVDAIAERHGFVSREPAPVRKKRWTPVTEPLEQLSIRCAVSDINTFVALADQRAETFRETFRYLVRLAQAEAAKRE